MPHAKLTHPTTIFEEGVTRTDAGRAFVRKVLHPPSVSGPEYNGCPDNNNTPSVQYQYRMNDNLSVSAGATTVGKESSGALMIQTSSMLYPIIQALEIGTPGNRWCNYVSPGSTITGMGQRNDAATNAIWPLNQTAIDQMFVFNSIRQTFKSTTYELNTNALTNKGTVTTSAFRPNIWKASFIGTTVDDVEFHADFPLSRYKNGKLFKDSLLQAHKDQINRVDSMNHAIQERRSTDEPTPQPFSISDTTVQIINLGPAISSTSQLMQASPRSTTELATEGAFVRSFYTQPVNEFKDVSYSSASGRVQNLLYCAYTWVNDEGESWISFFVNRHDGDRNNFKDSIQDLPWSDSQWHYVWFDGLDPVSFINCKTIMGYEVQSTGTNIISPLLKTPAAPDNLALESLSIITNLAPDSLPAIYNEHGPNTASSTMKEASNDEKVELETMKLEQDLVNTSLSKPPKGVRHPKKKAVKEKEERELLRTNANSRSDPGPTDSSLRQKGERSSRRRRRRHRSDPGPKPNGVVGNVNHLKINKLNNLNNKERKVIRQLRKKDAK